MKLIIPYHNDRDKSRREEIEYCLKENRKIFDKVFRLSEQKIAGAIKLSHRPTFTDLLRFASLFDGIKVIANSDILFTNLDQLKTIDYAERLVALTRWNIPDIGLPEFYGSKASQDCWVFKDTPDIRVDYCLGYPGIDNRIAYEADKAGYEVINPSLTIKTYHYHRSPSRDNGNKVPPPHKFIEPCKIRELPAKPVLLHYGEKKVNMYGFNYRHVTEEKDLLQKADIVLLQELPNQQILKKIKAVGWGIENPALPNIKESETTTLERAIIRTAQVEYPPEKAVIHQPQRKLTWQDKEDARQARIDNNEAEIQFRGYGHILSILIPTIEQRNYKFMQLLGKLISQINKNNLGKQVQVLHIKDKGKEEKIYYPKGKKRNDLIAMSDGMYVVCIDDDDDIHDEYVPLIVEATRENKDCITFNGKLTFKEGKTFPYNFSLGYKENKQVEGVYQRLPGHLTPIKREIAIKFKHKEFPATKDKGSDVMWSLDLLHANALKTSTHIDKEMYHYKCDPNNKQ